MFEFKLSRESEDTVMILAGEIVGDDDRDVLNEAFAIVQPNDNLIIDLSELVDIDSSATTVLYDFLLRRSAIAESVVVSSHAEVSMELVLHDVDRVCPIVTSVGSAIEILERPWSRRRLRH